eukprot:TRINITY_DN1883_c0_g4_i1.p1 TRINITY_DN1883_c0_g4~~TRINITY_DN1883_c0_g4_i1.p1  ORF type:complete len:676 (-),score=161.20 TRINITY_DN1883_c0_g4_i1:57-2084(-)
MCIRDRYQRRVHGVVRKKIDELTDKVAGAHKGIIDNPIVLHVHSPTCPDMSLIDLPGITRIKLKDSDQPENIEEITKNMALKYVSDRRTIILCVVPANIDITTSEALQMAQFVDSNGLRTIGVITKIDIMDKGTNAKKTLMGQDVALRLGFVGVKLRSQQDIKDAKGVQAALEDENKFFASHPIYSAMGPGYTGTRTLSNKLTKILYTHIKHNLPDITKEISERIGEVTDRLKELGPPMPEEQHEKLQMAWTMVIEFCDRFKAAIAGRSFDRKERKERGKNFQGGASIKIMYYNLLKEFAKADFKITEEYDDGLMDSAILMHEGDSMPGFPSADVFVSLIQPQIDKLKDPCMDLVQDVYNYLEELAGSIEHLTFLRFPSFGEEIMEKITEFMVEERENTRYLVESIIESETVYMFTNDPEYLISRTDIVPEAKPESKEEGKQEEGKMEGQMPRPTFQKENEKEKDKERKRMKKTKLFVTELRARLDTYFRIVVRNIRDTVPRLIGHFLVRAVQNKMQIELFKRLGKMREAVDKNLGEPMSIVEERKALNAQLETLRKAEHVLTRDPEITSMIGTTDDDLLFELRKEKAEGKENKPDEIKKFVPNKMMYSSSASEVKKEEKKEPKKEEKSIPTISAPAPSPIQNPGMAGTKPGSSPSNSAMSPSKSANLFGTVSKK